MRINLFQACNPPAVMSSGKAGKCPNIERIINLSLYALNTKTENLSVVLMPILMQIHFLANSPLLAIGLFSDIVMSDTIIYCMIHGLRTHHCKQKRMSS